MEVRFLSNYSVNGRLFHAGEVASDIPEAKVLRLITRGVVESTGQAESTTRKPVTERATKKVASKKG